MIDCIFCRIIAGEIPSYQIYSDDSAMAFLDVNPLHPGHTLIVPKQHIQDALSEPEILASLAPAVEKVGKLLIEKMGAEGMNIISNVGEIAGQSVFHLHIHLVPRYRDTPGLMRLLERSADSSDAALKEVFAKLTS